MPAKCTNLILLLVCLCLPIACGGGGEGGAGDPTPIALGPELAFGGPAPAGAVSIPPEEFAALLADGKLEVVTLAQIEEQEEDALAQMALDRARAEQVFRDHPEILERHVAEPDPADSDYEQLPDGSLLLRVLPEDPRTGGGATYVSLQGRRQAYAELADTQERYATAENQLGIYRHFHAQLDPAFLERHELPDPSTVAQASFTELEALNQKIAQAWTTLKPLPSGPPPGYPGDAASEEGYGGGIDGAGYASHPGMWTQIDFPLKWYATSVKNQGLRGTCVSFGITAAVETILALDRSRWVNLSEQMLYNRAKQSWNPSTYGDGLNLSSTLSMMRFFWYVYSWESSWDYNTSRARVDAGYFYLDSCVEKDGTTPYAGVHCSEANHQAPLFQTEMPWGTICGYLNPTSTVPPDARLGIGSPQALAGPLAVQLLFAKVALTLKNPVIISVTVGYTLKDGFVDSDGIVDYAPVPFGSGGHCMLLVGYVENADVPPGTPLGLGGGYFVCKNSWGTGYGDGGYCYLSDAWVGRWMRGMWTLDGVIEY